MVHARARAPLPGQRQAVVGGERQRAPERQRRGREVAVRLEREPQLALGADLERAHPRVGRVERAGGPQQLEAQVEVGALAGFLGAPQQLAELAPAAALELVVQPRLERPLRGRARRLALCPGGAPEGVAHPDAMDRVERAVLEPVADLEVVPAHPGAGGEAAVVEPAADREQRQHAQLGAGVEARGDPGRTVQPQRHAQLASAGEGALPAQPAAPHPRIAHALAVEPQRGLEQVADREPARHALEPAGVERGAERHPHAGVGGQCAGAEAGQVLALELERGAQAPGLSQRAGVADRDLGLARGQLARQRDVAAVARFDAVHAQVVDADRRGPPAAARHHQRRVLDARAQVGTVVVRGLEPGAGGERQARGVPGQRLGVRGDRDEGSAQRQRARSGTGRERRARAAVLGRPGGAHRQQARAQAERQCGRGDRAHPHRTTATLRSARSLEPSS